MARKLGRIVSYNDGNSLMSSHDPLTTWSRLIMWLIESLISSKTSMTTKLCRVVTYDEGNSSIMSQDSLTTSLHDKQQLLRPPSVVGWWFIMRTHPQCYVTLWPRCHMGSRDKLKTKYLLFHMVYDYHTWQGGDSWWGKLSHNLRWLFDHVITWCHVTNWKLNISSSTRSITTKHSRLVTYDERSPSSLQSFFCTRVMVFCVWENAHIIFWCWLSRNCSNFSYVGGIFCVFRFSTLALSQSVFLFSVV